MATKCPECGNRFSLRDALCDDWKDPNKSYGCPHCGTFFVKDMDPTKGSKNINILFAVGIILPAVNILGRALTDDVDPAITFNAAVIVICAGIIAYLKEGKWFRPLTKSPYRRPEQK